jgi:hypothetical protein
VVVLHGTRREMVPVPEMAAFAERFGFTFAAHEKGDANREAVTWCERANATRKKHPHASPRDLFAAERPHLVPLPLWVPEVYQLHHRIVDVEGYVASARGERCWPIRCARARATHMTSRRSRWRSYPSAGGPFD